MKKGVVLTLGVFDGMHLGHQALVRETVQRARRLRALPAALTFTNHPLNVLHHEGKVAFLYPREETCRELQRAGIRILLRVPFTERFSQLKPEEFIDRLRRRWVLKGIVVGENFRFGRGNVGNIRTLERLGQKWGFRVVPVPVRNNQQGVVSSSHIRRMLLNGRMDMAMKLLGRPFHIEGRVVKGRHVGRRLGYPTANVIDLKCFIPREGIYACAVGVNGRIYRAGLDLGTQPTISSNNRKPRAEVHLIGFKGHLYGKRIVIHLLKYLRAEIRFKDLASLARQIRGDIRRIRRMSFPKIGPD